MSAFEFQEPHQTHPPTSGGGFSKFCTAVVRSQSRRIINWQVIPRNRRESRAPGCAALPRSAVRPVLHSATHAVARPTALDRVQRIGCTTVMRVSLSCARRSTRARPAGLLLAAFWRRGGADRQRHRRSSDARSRQCAPPSMPRGRTKPRTSRIRSGSARFPRRRSRKRPAQRAYADAFRAAGLQNVASTSEGNVLGERPGRSARPNVVIQRAPRYRVSRRHRRHGHATGNDRSADRASATTAAASPSSSRSRAH